MNTMVALPILTAMPTTAPAMPTIAPAMPAHRHDVELVDAVQEMIAADRAIDRLLAAHDEDAEEMPEYKMQEARRARSIKDLIDKPAQSKIGAAAKANALQWGRLIEDWDHHRQVAISLAADIKILPQEDLRLTSIRKPDAELIESICEENNKDLEHMVGK